MTDPCSQYQKLHIYIDYYMHVAGQLIPQTIKAPEFVELLKKIDPINRSTFLDNYTFEVYHFPEMHENLECASEFTKNRYNMNGDEIFQYFKLRLTSVRIGKLKDFFGWNCYFTLFLNKVQENLHQNIKKNDYEYFIYH